MVNEVCRATSTSSDTAVCSSLITFDNFYTSYCIRADYIIIGVLLGEFCSPMLLNFGSAICCRVVSFRVVSDSCARVKW